MSLVLYSVQSVVVAYSDRLFRDDCLRDKTEYYENCSLLYCLPNIRAHM